jgi:hypothetical protein
VYRNTFTPQVADPENTAYDIAPKIVEHEDLPHRLALFVEQGVDLVLAGPWILTATFDRRNVMVKAQYPLDGRCRLLAKKCGFLVACPPT